MIGCFVGTVCPFSESVSRHQCRFESNRSLPSSSQVCVWVLHTCLAMLAGDKVRSSGGRHALGSRTRAKGHKGKSGWPKHFAKLDQERQTVLHQLMELIAKTELDQESLRMLMCCECRVRLPTFVADHVPTACKISSKQSRSGLS